MRQVHRRRAPEFVEGGAELCRQVLAVGVVHVQDRHLRGDRQGDRAADSAEQDGGSVILDQPARLGHAGSGIGHGVAGQHGDRRPQHSAGAVEMLDSQGGALPQRTAVGGERPAQIDELADDQRRLGRVRLHGGRARATMRAGRQGEGCERERGEGEGEGEQGAWSHRFPRLVAAGIARYFGAEVAGPAGCRFDFAAELRPAPRRPGSCPSAPHSPGERVLRHLA